MARSRALLAAPASERLYSIAEVADLWQVSRDTIERLLRSGLLRFVQVGPRRRRIPASALDEYLEEHAGA